MMTTESTDSILASDPTLLLEESGSLAVAAWHLVRARCGREEAPTRDQLRAVAREIATRCGYDVSPSIRSLVEECRRQGLRVQ